MTTTTAGEIAANDISTRAAEFARRAATKAHDHAKRGAVWTTKGVVTAAWVSVRRLGRGLWFLIPDLIWWLTAEKYQKSIDLCPVGNNTDRQRAEWTKRKAAAAARGWAMVWLLGLAALVFAGPPRVFGFPIPVMPVITAGLALGSTAIMWHGKQSKDAKDGKEAASVSWAWPVRLGVVFVVAFAAEWLVLAWNVPVVWIRWTVLALLVTAVVYVCGDGTARDNLGGKSKAEPDDPAKDDGAVLRAVKDAEIKLGPGAELTLVSPGVIPLANGALWKATLDTGGPSSEPIVAARDDLAARLGLSESRLIVERHREYGRRVDLTGIVGDPWGPPTRSPLLDAQRFAFGTDPLPYARTIQRVDIDLPLFEMHYLLGGMPRRGKSTSCYPIWVAAALDPLAPIWVIDGGEVDTVILRDAGLTRRWTTDPDEAYDVLEEIEDEVERRQRLLGEAKLKRPTPEFYAEHGMSDGLVAFDEFASFTNHPDTQLAKKISKKLVSLLQRSPKSNIHFILSTQSPSSQAFDTDGRGVVPGRIALLCDSSDMSDKVLGRYVAARLGIDASKLPSDAKGVQWIKHNEGAQIARPHLIDDDQMPTLIERARRLRTNAGSLPEVPPVVGAMAAIIRAAGALTMNSSTLVERLRRDERFAGLDVNALAQLVNPHNIRTEKIGGIKVYRLSDVERALTWAA